VVGELREQLGRAQRHGPRILRELDRGEHVLDEHRDVSRAVAERRHHDVEDGEPVIEIGAELAGVDLRAQVAVRGRDDADVHRRRLVGADAADLAALERAQQLRLEVERQLADLVEKQRPAVGRLDRTDALADRTGERAALVAE
jgi:hypothetical protein